MVGEWHVTYNPMGGYRAYRIRDIMEIDHSGNREYYGPYMDSKAEAEEIARKLRDGEIVPEDYEIRRG